MISNSIAIRAFAWVVLAALSLGGGVVSAQQSLESKIERIGDLPSLQVSGLKSAMRGRFMVVQTHVENLNNYPVALTYRFKWFDAAGFSVGQEESWIPVQIQARERVEFQGMATSPEAVDFRVVLHASP